MRKDLGRLALLAAVTLPSYLAGAAPAAHSTATPAPGRPAPPVALAAFGSGAVPARRAPIRLGLAAFRLPPLPPDLGLPPDGPTPAVPEPDDLGQAPAVRAAPEPARAFTVAATGDLLLHSTVVQQGLADGGREPDFVPMLNGISGVIKAADLAICHLETPLAPRYGPYSGYPIFSVPPQLVTAVRKIGYDTCSTASNHTIDKGEPGVRRTLAALDRAGLRHAGSARTAAEARAVTLIDVRGVAVAHLSYTYGTNGIVEPRGRSWLVNDGLDPKVILADAKRARAEGAEVVILSLHWGEEYRHEPTAQQTTVADKLLASPLVDLIVGHHAHVTQPFDRIGGKWVAYGLGNLVANPSAGLDATHEGAVGWFRFERTVEGWQVTPAFVPTRITAGPPIRLRNAATDRRSRGTLREVTWIVRSLGERVPVLR